MGLLSKTAQFLGFGKQQGNVKAIDTSAAQGAFSEIFGGGSAGPSFSSFNSMRAQMLSYYDWVYAAASRVAEEAACIDIEIYINNSTTKSASLGRKIGSNHKTLQRYKKLGTKKTLIVTRGGRMHVVRAGTPTLEEVDESPLMDLLDRPNKFMSGQEFFELTFLHLELTGNAFWAIIRDNKKQPVELWPLYPNYMRIVEDAHDFISGYVYTVNGEQVPFLPEDIIHHKYSNPNDLRWGMSTVMAGARVIDTDKMAADYNRKFFYNSAQPDAVLYTDEMIDDKTWLRIKDQFQDMYGGINNAHKTAILENGLKYQAMNPNQKDMDFLRSREFNRDMILAMFGVPKSVLGMDASMSRANAETAEYVFAKGTIKPKMLRLTTGIQEKLAPMFDERYVITFVDPVPDDKQYKLAEHKQLANLVLTANEVREDMGYEAIDNGDTLYVLGNMVPIGTPVAPTGGAAPEEGDQIADTDEDIHDEDTGGEGGTGGDSNTSTGGDTTSTSTSSDSGSASGAASKALAAIAKGPLPVPPGCLTCMCCKGYGEHLDTGFECYRCDASGSVTENENKQPVPCDGFYADGGESHKGTTTVIHNTITLTDPAAVEKFMALFGADAKKKDNVSPKEYLDKRNAVADKYEPQVISAILAHMAKQEKEVLANLPKHIKAIQAATTKRAIKANLENLFDPKASASGWMSSLSVIFEKIISAMGIISIKQLEDALDGADIPPYDPTDPSVEKFYTERIRRVSVYFDEETQKQLAATLREGIDKGESVDDLRKRVHNIYDATQEGKLMAYRAERVGRTEPIFATTWTTLDAWKKSGMVIGKRWHTAPGAVPAKDNPCSFCRAMDGKITELESNYFDQGDKMTVTDDNDVEQTMKLDYVDTVGPPLHPNCRCTLLPVLEGESLD